MAIIGYALLILVSIFVFFMAEKGYVFFYIFMNLPEKEREEFKNMFHAFLKIAKLNKLNRKNDED